MNFEIVGQVLLLIVWFVVLSIGVVSLCCALAMVWFADTTLGRVCRWIDAQIIKLFEGIS